MKYPFVLREKVCLAVAAFLGLFAFWFEFIWEFTK